MRTFAYIVLLIGAILAFNVGIYVTPYTGQLWIALVSFPIAIICVYLSHKIDQQIEEEKRNKS